MQLKDGRKNIPVEESQRLGVKYRKGMLCAGSLAGIVRAQCVEGKPWGWLEHSEQ